MRVQMLASPVFSSCNQPSSEAHYVGKKKYIVKSITKISLPSSFEYIAALYKICFLKPTLYSAVLSPFGSIWGMKQTLRLDWWYLLESYQHFQPSVTEIVGVYYTKQLCPESRLLHQATSQSDCSVEAGIVRINQRVKFMSALFFFFFFPIQPPFGFQNANSSYECDQIPIRDLKKKAFWQKLHCRIQHHLFNSGPDPLTLWRAIFRSPQRLAIWPD